MATFSGPILNFTGIKILANGAGHSKMPFQIHKHEKIKFSEFHHPIALASRRTHNLQKLYFPGRSSAMTHILSAGRNYELNYDDGSRTEPFWLNMVREIIWAIRDLFLFLAEQPSQLKYIEWPSFRSTLKTALLTLVLVAIFIVALSSVDSALSYLLSLFLRRRT